MLKRLKLMSDPSATCANTSNPYDTNTHIPLHLQEIKILKIVGDGLASSSSLKKASSRATSIMSKASHEETPISVQQSVPMKTAHAPKVQVNRVENITKFMDDIKAINNSDTGDGLVVTNNNRTSPRSTIHNSHRRSLLERKETLQEQQALRKKRNREIYELFALDIATKHGLKSYVPIE